MNKSISQNQQELDRISSKTVNVEKFIFLAKGYTNFTELTPLMINEFIEKILVHKSEDKGASHKQKVEIFFNFVGKVELPHDERELTPQEITEQEDMRRRREKKAEYNRRYMAKKRKQWNGELIPLVSPAGSVMPASTTV